MQQPQLNIPYRRSRIQEMCGGELQTFLPQNEGIICAGCFTIEEMNPAAPVEIQVGNAAKAVAKAKLLSQQPGTIFPVFLKQRCSDREYFFQGYFKFKNISEAPDVIAEAEARSGRKGELACVLILELAQPGKSA